MAEISIEGRDLLQGRVVDKSSSAPRKPRPDQARQLAFALITDVNQHGAYANIRMPQLLTDSGLDVRDKAFATELGYGCLRMQGKYDFAISEKIDRPFLEVDPKIIDLLRMGCHQIFGMRVPTHAAVSATVELARKVAGESKASYVNALLRSISSDEELFSDLEQSSKFEPLTKISVKYSHPEWVISSYHDALKNWESVEELLAFNNIPVAPHLAAWKGKSTKEELIEAGATALNFSSSAVLSTDQPSNYKAVKERRAGVQDLGSQLVSEIFYETRKVGHPHSWLDLCAGPGGKAAWLFNALATERPNDRFLANEPTEHRAELVARVIPRQNISHHDGRVYAEFDEKFDRILVDAPCTGLGALRRRPEARWRKAAKDLKELVALQRELLDCAYEMLTPGGILGYATCSPHLAETLGQVLDMQYRHKEVKIIPIDAVFPLPPGAQLANGTMQLWSHKHGTDSMFLALFQKPE
ncbi:MAG: transcription antitermination factor NusB [Actinomycetes bacterium]